MNHRLVMEYLLSQPWAILEEWLRLGSAIVARDDVFKEDSLESIQRQYGPIVRGTRDTMLVDGVAILPVSGPLTRYASFFSDISGLTSYEGFSRELAALQSAKGDIRHIIVDVNSPGGEVDGLYDTVAVLAAYRADPGAIPMTGYVSFLAASGGYALASEFDRLVINESAVLGSIGTVMKSRDYSGALEERGIREIEFVSAQSPKKRPDPFSADDDVAKAGADEIQQLVDSLAQVLIDRVVSGPRGITEEQVLAVAGGVLVGQKAVDAGLADEVGTLDALLGEIIAGSQKERPITMSASALDIHTEDGSMSDKGDTPVVDRAFLDANHPDLVTAIRAEGAEAERARVQGILSLNASGFEALRDELLADPTCTKGMAAERLLRARGEREKQLAQEKQDKLNADEDSLKDVGSASGVGEGDSEEQMAAAIRSHFPQNRREEG